MSLVAKASAYLAGTGATTPRLDAELLLAEALRCGRLDLYLQFERPLETEELDRFRKLCQRRASGEPMAYIRGRKEFMSIEFLVTPAVMVPRPETELLVEEARTLCASLEGEVRILDVGTGSGVIALSVLSALPSVTAVATDISDGALEVARENAARLGLSERVEFVAGDLADGVEGRFQLVLANLPYIDPHWPDAVTAEVAATEPALALYGGAGGLEVIDRLLPRLHDLLVPGGSALLEFDPRHAEDLRGRAAGHGAVRVLNDLAGLERLLVLTP